MPLDDNALDIILRLQDELSPALAKAQALIREYAKDLATTGSTGTKAFKELEDSSRSALTPLQSMADAIVANAAGFVSAQAVIGTVSAGIHILAGFVEDSVHAYAESESAQVKLTAALRQHSLATPEVIALYNDLASSFQQTTIYADEQINAMEGLLTQVGGIMPSKMRDALKASTDLASGLGIDLQSATMLVAKAAAGHTETLGRYGITVNEAEIATKGFDAVLEAVNRQFGGQATAAIDTYNGRVAQIGNAWNNVQEALGKIILNDPLVVQALNRIADAANRADKEASASSRSLADLLADFQLTDRGTAQLLNWLGEFIADLNAYEGAIRRLNSMETPFAKIAREGQLPPITAGLKLFNEETAESERRAKLAKEAFDKWRDSLADLAAAGVDWHATLDTIDGAVEAGIQYYLAAGVSQEKLAAAYGLTAVQIRASATALQQEHTLRDSIMALDEAWTKQRIAGTTSVEAAERDLADFIAKSSLDTANYEILKVWQAVDEKEKAYAGDETNRARYNAAIEALATAQAQAIRDAADSAAASENHVADSLERVADATVTATDNFTAFKNTLVLGITDIASVNEALDKFYDSFALFGGVGAFNGAGGVGTPVGNSAGMPRIPGGIQARDIGGPVTAGMPYYVGRGAQPELFVPSTNGTMYPNGSASASSSQPRIIQVVMPNGRVLAQVVDDEVTREMRQQRQYPAP